MPKDTFEDGLFYAAAQVQRLHDEPTVAADLLKQAGYASHDCSAFDEYEKESLREIKKISGMVQTGLDG